MKVKNNKFISLVLVLAMVFSYFLPIRIVSAESITSSLAVSFREGSNAHGKVQYSLNDGASWLDIENDTTVNNFAVTGDNLKIRIVTDQNYSVDFNWMALKLDGVAVQNISSIGLNTNNGYAVPNTVESVSLEQVEIREDVAPPPVTPPAYDDTAHVSVTVLGTEIENPYGEAASEVRVSVNSDYYYSLANDNVVVTPDNEDPEKTYSVATVNPIDIGYYDVSESSIVLGIKTQWNTFLTDVIVNNHSYAEQLPTNKNGLIAIYNNQNLIFEIEVPKDPNSNYNVVIEGRKQANDELIMGNFLWDYNENGYTDQGDKIYHSTLEFVKAVYNNQTYNTIEAVNAAGSLFDWHNVERQDVYPDEGSGVGSATFPVGTMLTVDIIPDAGYQLVSFGVNEGGFEPQEQIGRYTFEIQGGNFHLQAHVEDVDNAVNADNTNAISNGSIVFGGNEQSMAIGTARLDITDNNNLTANQTAAFENAAGDYEVQDVFDISLYNTVFKGSRTASWDTPVDELNNNATITLEMTDNLNGKDIKVIHETHDGDYEEIAVNYNEQNNTISFETDSFSNYALTTKGEGSGGDPETPVVKHTVEFNSDGGSTVENVLVEHGKVLERPKAPTKDGFTFGGWFIDPELNYSYDFEGPVENDFTLTARWIDNDDLKDYTVTDANGNSISFIDEEGHTYNLSILDILSMSKEEILAMNPEVTEEAYNQMMDLLKNLASNTGELLKLYEINVFENNTNTGDTTDLHEGPFQIKIKITDDMKKYNTFKLVYLKNDFTLGEVVNLTVEGDYLVGSVPHLSTYMLTGSTTTNPSTGDNIMTYVSMFGLSVVSLVGIGIYTRKKKH